VDRFYHCDIRPVKIFFYGVDDFGTFIHV
jgi:hypothetical protein